MDTNNLPTVIDYTAEQVEAAVTERVSEEVCSNITRELFSEWSLRFERPPVESDGTSDPIATSNYLRVLLDDMQRKVAELAGGYSSARWLWYLRRLPRHVFEGMVGNWINLPPVWT